MLLLLSVVLAAGPEVNLLTLEAGTAPIEVPPTYGGAWALPAMFDGAPGTGWCSTDGAKGPFQMTFELEQRSAVTRVEVDNTGAEEADNPGISAKNIEVWTSSVGPAQGFALAAKLTVPKSGTASAAPPKDTVARWVRVIVRGNWGHARYTEVMELSVRGRPLEPRGARPLSGTWKLDHGPLLLLGEGGGCEVQGQAPDAWLVKTETVEGRSAQLGWSQVGTASAGTASVVVADDGTLHGVWRYGGSSSISGVWLGRPLKGPPLDCRTALEDARFRARLVAEPRGLVLGGVSFAGDEVKLEEQNDLVALRRLLSASTVLRARVMVLGKAADPATDELKRCERRAQRVLQYLLTGGAAAAQVEVGFGLVRIGSVVQLEPRVEVQLDRR